MQQRLTERARRVMAAANKQAQQWRHEFIGTEHILMGLTEEKEGLAAAALRQLGIAPEKIREAVSRIVKVGREEAAPGLRPPTPRAKKVVEYAVDEADSRGHEHVGVEHLLLALLRADDGVAAQVLMQFASARQFRDAVDGLMKAGRGEALVGESLRKELVRFWRQFGILLSSGVPVLQSLEILRNEQPEAEWRGTLDQVMESVRNGKTVSSATEPLSTWFSPAVVALVRAGEHGGVLDVVCERVAKGLEAGALPVSAEPDAAMAEVIECIESAEPDEPADEDDTVARVNELILRAFHARASDIHLEPLEGGGQTRLRVDGVMQAPETLGRDAYDAMTSRVKIMACMDITERRRPQDGRIKLNVEGRELDLRVSSVPFYFGESIVMRILDRQSVHLDIERLGCSEETLAELRGWMRRPNGLYIVSGPTGCGKTTVLYSLLQLANRAQCKVMTAEDPVEFLIDGVLQAPVQPRLGSTFPVLVRSFLRQDPDVILIGEVRDHETLNVAIQAALTGHLILTTLHTNGATDVPGRMADIGVDPWLGSVALSGAASLRLVRQVCSECVEPYTPKADSVLEGLPDEATLREASFVHGVGCEKCLGSGYRGRTGIFETLPMTDEVHRLIRQNASPAELRQAAVRAGMVTMRHDGARKAAAGVTTLEEVLRVTVGVE